MSLHELYQEIIVDHGKSPRHFGELAGATHLQSGHNPLCGDQLVIYVIEQDGLIQDVQFKGSGCAISMASASLMIEAIKGKSISEFAELFDCFHILVTKGEESNSNMGKLLAFSGVAQYPIRVKCATLAWHTLKAALENKNETVSTEGETK
jgi:nitrogen fixation NifU-like protein